METHCTGDTPREQPASLGPAPGGLGVVMRKFTREGNFLRVKRGLKGWVSRLNSWVCVRVCPCVSVCVLGGMGGHAVRWPLFVGSLGVSLRVFLRALLSESVLELDGGAKVFHPA